MVAGDELGVGFGEVERRAVRLGDARDEEDEQADELRRGDETSPWRWTISTSVQRPAMITTPSTASASETSYETSCAHVRIEPSSEYFDSDAQPPTMNP